MLTAPSFFRLLILLTLNFYVSGSFLFAFLMKIWLNGIISIYGKQLLGAGLAGFYVVWLFFDSVLLSIFMVDFVDRMVLEIFLSEHKDMRDSLRSANHNNPFWSITRSHTSFPFSFFMDERTTWLPMVVLYNRVYNIQWFQLAVKLKGFSWLNIEQIARTLLFCGVMFSYFWLKLLCNFVISEELRNCFWFKFVLSI